MSTGSILDSILPELIQNLNITNIRPHLKQARLLTDDEYHRLELSPNNTPQDAVEKLVEFLKSKGPGYELLFLQVLKRSIASDCHRGHEYIVSLLEEGFASRCPTGNPATNGPALAHSNGFAAVENSTYRDSPIASSNRDEHLQSDSLSLPHAVPGMNGTGIEEHYRGMCLQESASSSTLDSKAPLKLAQFESLEGSKRERSEIQDLRCKVARDSENIIMRFAKFVLAVYRLLDSKQVPVREVRLTLCYLGCFKGVAPGGDNVLMFGSSSDINQAEDLAKLIECLRNYSSWFNYRPLKFIAEEFGREEGKMLVADYEDDLTRYFENVIAYQCPEFSLVKGIPPGFEQLDVKVDWDYKSCRAQDVVIFQAKLSDLLRLEPHVFQLKSIEDGCVCLTWLIPSALVPHIIMEVRLQKSKLEEMYVLNVQVMGKGIEISRESKHRFPPDCEPPSSHDPVQNAKMKTLRPMASNGSTVSSNSSAASSLSELSPSKKSMSGSSEDERFSNRSSCGSTVVDFGGMPTNAVEIEILSVYSGVSGSMSHSGSSSPSAAASKESLLCHNTSSTTIPSHSPHQTQKPSPLSKSFRLYQSADNLRVISPLLLTATGRELRAGSHCEGIKASGDEQGAKSLERAKGARCRRPSLITPMKLLRKFLRVSKKRVASDGSIEKGDEDSGVRPSFPILNLSEEPWRQRDFSQDFDPTATTKKLPTVTLSRDESIRTVVVGELTAESPEVYSIHDRQPKGRLSVPSVSSGYVSESPTRSTSPTSITTPTFHSQLSDESVALSDPLDQCEYSDHFPGRQFPRRRSNSAPNKFLHDIRRTSDNYDSASLSRRKSKQSLQNAPTGRVTSPLYRPTSDHYTELSDPSRVASPPSRRTSDYFSDITSLSGPSSPPSINSSEFTSQESVCTVVSQPGQPQLPRQSKPPLRAHSLNDRSRNATRASPLVKSQSHSAHLN